MLRLILFRLHAQVKSDAGVAVERFWAATDRREMADVRRYIDMILEKHLQ